MLELEVWCWSSKGARDLFYYWAIPSISPPTPFLLDFWRDMLKGQQRGQRSGNAWGFRMPGGQLDRSELWGQGQPMGQGTGGQRSQPELVHPPSLKMLPPAGNVEDEDWSSLKVKSLFKSRLSIAIASNVIKWKYISRENTSLPGHTCQVQCHDKQGSSADNIVEWDNTVVGHVTWG